MKSDWLRILFHYPFNDPSRSSLIVFGVFLFEIVSHWISKRRKIIITIVKCKGSYWRNKEEQKNQIDTNNTALCNNGIQSIWSFHSRMKTLIEVLESLLFDLIVFNQLDAKTNPKREAISKNQSGLYLSTMCFKSSFLHVVSKIIYCS